MLREDQASCTESRHPRHEQCGEEDGSDRPTQLNNKTHSMNHAGDKHPLKMGVFSRRVWLKLKSSRAKNLRTDAGDN